MKAWKKTVISVLAVGIFVCSSFALPELLKDYEDNKYISQVSYVDSSEMDIFQYKESQKMSQKIELLSQVLGKYKIPEILKMEYDMEKMQVLELENKIKEEMGEIFLNGLYVRRWEEYQDLPVSLKSYTLCHIYGSNVSYIRAVCQIGGRDVFYVYIDSLTYKIYLIKIKCYLTEWEKKTGEYDIDSWFVTDIYLKDFLKNYYELEQKTTQSLSLYMADGRFTWTSFLLAPNVQWRTEWEQNEEGGIDVYIGIREFEIWEKYSVNYHSAIAE